MDKKEKLEKYFDKAKDLANSAKDVAQSAKDQTAAYSVGAKEKVQGMMQDVKAGKEIEKAIEELDAFRDFEGSILYKMELETMINSLNNLLLVVRDNRLDNASVIEEIEKVMEKAAPAAQPAAEESAETDTDAAAASAEPAASTAQSEEEAMTEKAKSIAYNTCLKVLDIVQG